MTRAAIVAAAVFAAAAPAAAQTVTLGAAIGDRLDGMHVGVEYADPIADQVQVVARYLLACTGLADADCRQFDAHVFAGGVRVQTGWRGRYRVGVGFGAFGVGGEGGGGGDVYGEIVVQRAISRRAAISLALFGNPRSASGRFDLTGVGAGFTIRVGPD